MLNDWKAAILRHVPRPEDLFHAGELYLGPAAGAALIVFALVILVLGRQAALAAGSLAMMAGFAVANYRQTLFPWWPAGQNWHWLPLLFLLAQFDGLFARVPTVPIWGGWRLRLVLGFLTALVIVPADLYEKLPVVVETWPYLFRAKAWPLIAFMLIVALGWYNSESVARKLPGGAVGIGLSLALFGASLVVLHARWASVAEAITYPAAALLGVSLVALVRKCDVGGALPGVAVILPSLLLTTYYLQEGLHTIPWYAFLLAGLPPMTIGLLAIPPFSRMKGVLKWLLFWVLCLGPTIAAVLLAARAESLETGEDEWAAQFLTQVL